MTGQAVFAASGLAVAGYWIAGVLAVAAVLIVLWRLWCDRSKASWRVEVERRLARVGEVPGDARAEIQGYLDKRSIGSWWTGRSEDLAHAVIDRVEKADLSGLEADERRVLAERLIVEAGLVYASKDARLVQVKAFLKDTPSRVAMEQAYDLIHDGWSRMRRAQRARRNRSIEASIGFVVAGLGLAWMLDNQVGHLTLAAHEAASTSGGGTEVDAATAPLANAWALLALGAIGGLVSLLPMVRRTPDITRSSGAWTAQAALKVTSACLLGLLGCWLLQTGIIAATQPLPAEQIGIWAVLFGYSQDAVTKRFDELLAPAPAPTTATTDDETGN